MKKQLLLITLLFFFLSGMSQTVTTVSEGFESATFPPSGWSDIGGTAPSTAWTRVTAGTSPTTTPHSGSAMARFNCFSIGAGQTRTLATSVIDYSTAGCSFTKTVSLWMYRDNGYSSYGDSVSIYINTTASLTGATYINRVARSRSINQPNTEAANGWYQYTFNIPAGFNGATNYLLFKGTSQYGNNIFMDDVQWNFCTNNCTGTPAAGVATGPGTACSGAGFGLSATGFTTGGTMSYKWQSSPNGLSGWVDIPGQTNAASASVSQTVATYYRLFSTCGNSGLTNNSNAIQVNMNPFYYCYCNPATGTILHSFLNDYFTNITISGTALNYSAPAAPPEGYTQVLVGTATATLQQTVSYNISVTLAGTPGQVTVYADWNGNGTYEVSEETNLTVGATTATGNLVVPPGATLGLTGLRIRGRSVTFATGLACGTFGSGETEDYVITIGAAPSCTQPTGLTNSAITQTSASHSWTAATGSPLGYEWAVTTSATPPASGTATALLTASSSGLTSGTQYYLHVRTSCAGATFSAWASSPFNTQIANDDCSGAVVLTIGSGSCGGATNASTAGATPSGTLPVPTCGVGSSGYDDDVWFRFTPSAGQTIMNLDFISLSGNSDMVAQIYTSSDNTCAGTFTAFACSDDDGPGSMPGFGPSTVPITVVPGTTYYVRVFTYGTAVSGAFSICAYTPPPPPACVTNISPANAATGVAISPNIPISWNAAATATSYDIFFGTTNPPTVNIGNVAAPATTIGITGANYNTTYYWYVVPKGAGGDATGCSSNTTSFTTLAPPVNCVPLTGSGCTGSDNIDLFRLKGETTELFINNTTCAAGSYTDTTDHPVVIDLSVGKSYWGQLQAGTTGDYLTLWLDANNNGLYENNERLMNNIPMASAAAGNFNLFIPLGTALGNHTLRARLVYYSTPPTAVTDPCGPYTYSDTKDFKVNIVNGGSSYTVSSYATVGSCYTGGGDITIDAASNNNSNYVPLVDSSNALIVQVYPQGNNLGTVRASYYHNNGAVRQDPNGIYYMDRNISVGVSKQPVTPYNIRLPYLNSELNALIAQPGSGVTSQFDLVTTKNGDGCRTAVLFPGTVYFPTGFGSIGVNRFIDVTNLTGFSSFYLHGGATPIPVNLLTFTAQRISNKINQLSWSTSQEINTSHFILERSADGRNFIQIGQVAAVGNSNVTQQYAFSDANPVIGINYYRLKMVDRDNSYKYSWIRNVRNEGLADVAVYPNPVNDVMTVSINADKGGKAGISISDASGKSIYRNNVTIAQGANNIPVNTSNIASGTYIIKVQMNEDVVVRKFTKL